MPSARPAPPEERIRQQRIFRSPLVEVGEFRAPAGSPLFRAVSPPGHFAVVFPRTSVRIRHEEGDDFVTDQRTVAFYNPDDLYRRDLVDPRGDFCTWLSARESTIREITGSEAGERRGRPFWRSSGPCPSRTFLLERRLVAGIHRGGMDPLEVEESALEIIAGAWKCARGDDRRRSLAGFDRAPSRWLVRRALDYIAAHYADAPSLDEIAGAVGCSTFHLCRVFRRQTGRTLHGYRSDLALRAAYDRVERGEERLVDVAMDLGFSSHSHLTRSFVRRFGLRPSELRAAGARSSIAL